MSSSNIPGLPWPLVLTNSLDTEVGRDTIVDSSSSSHPTLGSTDAGWPQSAHAQKATRSAPQHRPPASTTQVLVPGNTHGNPAAPPAPGPPAVGPPSAAAVDTQLLQILIQPQQQQQHQMKQMMQMMQGIMTQPAPPVRVPTPPCLP